MKKLLFRISGIFAMLGAPLIIASAAHAAADTCTWTGGGSDENFSTAANWSVCDNGNVPENGDSLVFPTTVDSDTTSGDDRELNNDISSLSVAGITVNGGNYSTGDYDFYTITGNDLTITGNIVGAPGTQYSYRMVFEVGITVGAPLAIDDIRSTQGLSIGSHNVMLLNAYFDGSLSGSGVLTLTGRDGSSGGGACNFYGDVSTTYGYPFMGVSSGFSGPIVVGAYGAVGITALPTSFARNASSITTQANSNLNFILNSGQDMTFAVPMTLGGGSIRSTQSYIDDNCDTHTAHKTVTISGAVNVTAPVEVSMYRTNITFSGAVTGGDNLSVQSGGDPNSVLTIGGEEIYSETEVTTYSGDQSSQYPSVGENQVAVVEAGATTNNVFVYGGVLKGSGTVGNISMGSGTVAPGMSPGCLASGNLQYTGGTLEIEIDGATVCTQYDQQTVTGTVDLGTATALNIIRLSSYRPALNGTYIIISNDGVDTVTGTFVGLAQGGTVVVDGVTYSISYTGGDGNDVVLVVTAVDDSVGAPNTGVLRIIKSGIVLPLLVILASVGILSMNYLAAKKR